MPGWQAFFHPLKDKNFEIISIAQDTGGARDAAEWINAAKPEYTALVDDKHLVTQLYNMVNVPTAVWINEKGGRAFYTIKGHSQSTYAEAPFRDLMLRGILWAVHRLPDGN